MGSFMPFSFYSWGQSTRCSLYRKLGWLQSWSRLGVDRSHRTHRQSNPNPASSVFHNLVTILAELHCSWKCITFVYPRKQHVIQAKLAEKIWVFVVIVSLTFYWSQCVGCFVYNKLRLKFIRCSKERALHGILLLTVTHKTQL